MDTPQPQELQRNDKGQITQGVAQDTNKNGTAGRPTKYQPEFVGKVDEYIGKVQRGELFHEYFPTKEGFSLFIGVDSQETITRWANKRYKKDDPKIDPKLRGKLVYPDFYGAITRLVSIQKIQIMNDGMYLGKKVNDKMAKFILSVNHGMVETEKQEVDVTTQGKPLDFKLVSYQDIKNG